MAGHIDVRVKVHAPLEVMWEVSNEMESGGTATRHSPGHDVISWDPDKNRIAYRITTAPDSAGHAWSYSVERTTDVAAKTAYARRWGNEFFAYSYAFWQYTGSGDVSEIRCVADFEMTPQSPLSDQEMAAFMERGTRAAMERTARAAEAVPRAGSAG
jgi:aromatase